MLLVAESGRPGRAELLANFFGGAVWGNFRENAKLRVPSRYPAGTLYISPGPNCENPAKIRQKKKGQKLAKICQIHRNLAKKLAKFSAIFDENFEH